jgi:alkylhydroperoxidase family enzyme
VAALAVAEAMTLGDGELPAALWQRLREHFDDAELVELFAIVAWENFRSRFNKAAGLEAQGFCPAASRAAVSRGCATAG